MSLATPEKIRKLQRALYVKAKHEPTRRFHFLYDKVWREDILTHAYARCRSNGGAPGVDGETFTHIEGYGVDRWLNTVREEVRTGRYRPQPVKRVMIPKSGGVGQRPLGIPTIRDRVVQTAAEVGARTDFRSRLRWGGLRVSSQTERAGCGSNRSSGQLMRGTPK